jgi:NAD(P)-dependent dehydrogenase (short-subunit alcohol dehydrogenase family)
MTKPYAVPSQEGRIAIVTGASGGIGLWTALGLTKAGAHTVMLCRDARRGEEARRFVAERSGRVPELILADFADLAQVRAAGAEIAERHRYIHILVNNAGLFAPKRTLTKDGYELTFAVNHLAPFLLTDTLLPALELAGEASRHARIVNVASAAANRASIDLGDLMSAPLQNARRLRPVEARQHPLHKGAGPPPAAQAHIGELPASRGGCDRYWKQRRDRGARVAGDQAFHDRPRARRGKLVVRGHVAGHRRRQRRLFREAKAGQAESDRGRPCRRGCSLGRKRQARRRGVVAPLFSTASELPFPSGEDWVRGV